MSPRRPQPIPEARLRRLVGPLLEELGKANRERLEHLLPLFTDGKARLSECLKAIFPGVAQSEAQGRLRVFRKAVNDTATQINVSIEFKVDSRLKDPPEARTCWFEAPDSTVEEIETFSRDGTADIERGTIVRSLAISTSGKALAAQRRTVRFFVSYAHEDEVECDTILNLLSEQYGKEGTKRYRYEVWSDGKILIGERWHERIQQELRRCDFGLLLVSPSFLNSEYISEKELPTFEGGKPIIPVCLKQINFDRHDLKGLEQHQIFFLKLDSGRKTKPFFYCDKKERQRFAEELFNQIEERLDSFFKDRPTPLLPVRRPDEEAESLAEELARTDPKHFIRTRGASYGLRDLERIDLKAGPSVERGVDALDLLETWAFSEDQPPFFALLGEYGIGKTTTLKQLTRRLLDKHRQDPACPLPIFVDLRQYISGQDRRQVPTLDEILTEVVRRNWKSGQTPTLTAKEIIEMVQSQGALILFDGLDEKIVHLTPDRARQFIRELWRVLPPFRLEPSSGQAGPAAKARPGRMLLSCRSHYFKDVWSQNAMLTGEDREGGRAEDYRACILLPFNENQVRDYLAALLGDPAKAAAAVDLFASVHNLSDLARRPYLLAVMAEELGQLEAMRARGDKVLGVTLYELLTTRWLNRDDGKHHFTHTHKLELMEHLAAAMWQAGAREWEWPRVEQWLDGFLGQHPDIASRYLATPGEVLNEDLRTATFVLRPDDCREHFRFAHTSLQEYFLARYLWRALEQGQLDSWDMDLPSIETLDFLGQLLESKGGQGHLRVMETLLTDGQARPARLAFRYWLLAVEKGYPEPSPDRPNLAGLDLEGWTIRGHEGRPLYLRGANLTKARLDHARLQYVDLADADLTGTSCALAEFRDVSLNRAVLEEADLTGAVLRKCEAQAIKGQTAKWYDTDWIDCDLREAYLPEDFAESGSLARCLHIKVEVTLPMLPASDLEPIIYDAHCHGVSCCTWSPDGRQVVSGSWDHTLRIWDAASGRSLQILKGHQGGVLSCGCSPEGQQVVSGSDDETLRIWEVGSGRCLLILKGHQGGIFSCGWSPDGRQVVSGSYDGSLRIWDAASGQCLRVLNGHKDSVWACGWSPDGRQIISGSWDRSIRIWEASSGRCLRVLKGHQESVQSCRWSPDGMLILSGSLDKTLRIWEVSSGRCLRVLKGHQNWISSCGWSPDSRQVVSASRDHTLRIWDAVSGKCLRILKGHQSQINACMWSSDRQQIVSGSWDETLRIWEAGSGRCLQVLVGYHVEVYSCGWSPDGQQVASGSNDGTLCIWEVGNGKCQRILRNQDWLLSPKWTTNSLLLSGSSNKVLRIWDGLSGQDLKVLEGHQATVTVSEWSVDGKKVVSGANDHTLRVWDIVSGRCLRIFKHQEAVMSCAWSPDSQYIAGSSDEILRIWELRSGQCLWVLEGHQGVIRSCRWSPDGRQVASGSLDRTLRIWDITNGQCLQVLEGHQGEVWTCGWSPDGRKVVSGSDDNTLRIWDTTSAQCLLILDGHQGKVWSCEWSPDGQHLVSGSSDSTLRIWDTQTGRLLTTFVLVAPGEAATIDNVNRRFLWASPSAWRHLGWRGRDEWGRLRILPAEFLGPLPG